MENVKKKKVSISGEERVKKGEIIPNHIAQGVNVFRFLFLSYIGKIILFFLIFMDDMLIRFVKEFVGKQAKQK